MAADYLKDPDAVLDYKWDWSSWLQGGETISSSVFTVTAGLTVNSTSNTTTTATVWLAGGTAGLVYSVGNRITTSLGRTDERTVQIRVQER